MPPSSSALAEKARKVESNLLQGIHRSGQSRIAEAVGVSEATISRLKTEQLAQVAAVIAAAGMKVVPDTMRCYPAKKMNAILELARDHLNAVDSVEQLSWEEE